MSDKAYNWKQFHAYRVFDEFLDRLVLQRRSYVTNHQQVLDLDSALEEIRNRFVDGFDDSKRKFENKVNIQFTDASENTKITFANIEYLWAMPMGNISPKKKRSYALRWFSDSDQVVKGERFFFRHPHAIANPGPWFLRNKYWELIALLRVLREVTTESRLSDLEKVKARIGNLCHSAIYDGVPADAVFSVSKVCGIHSALMHLSDPERYESIIGYPDI